MTVIISFGCLLNQQNLTILGGVKLEIIRAGELGHFQKDFVRHTQKKAPQVKILQSFVLNTLKTTFLMENLTQRCTQSGTLFSKIRTLFIFEKVQ